MPTALVTGATEGIGRATALALGRAGWRVGVCARTASKVEAVAAELGAAGIEAAGADGDVGTEGDAARIARAIQTALGPIDTLVNNAGVAVFKPFLDQTLEDWDRMMATNVRSLYLMTREVLPGMLERRTGAIVNVASLAGRNGVKGATGYAASKHAVLGFSRSLMLEVRAQGIRVMAICPGSVDTALIRDHEDPGAPPRRILHPDDVAATIVAALQLPERALVSELDVRPANP
ncbi:MAG TPA: SDR family NAD(P)-dependent oxidoreductase [Gemmatimonadales bacterium]|nr:SDR family NAD(P)-dependent oxidoreductase [Gemmatimonadales bacterium]